MCVGEVQSDALVAAIARQTAENGPDGIRRIWNGNEALAFELDPVESRILGYDQQHLVGPFRTLQRQGDEPARGIRDVFEGSSRRRKTVRTSRCQIRSEEH